MTVSAPALYLAGVGSVGTAFLHRLARLGTEAGQLIGACTTRGALWRETGLSPEDVLRDGTGTAPPNWRQISEDLLSLARTGRPVVFADATSSSDIAREYLRLLDGGVRVVTASKHANTFEQSYFDALLRASAEGTRYRYETTVGAALPAVQTVRDLRASGDTIERVECSPSGTLTFVMDQLSGGTPFSAAVLDARAKGYAEPDVRDDLSGEDVVRKLMILARTAGYRVERDEVKVEPLLPPEFAQFSTGEVAARLPDLDDAWAARIFGAESRGRVLRYVGRLEDGRIRVGVEEVAAESALGSLSGTDNVFVFRTERYGSRAITISGPGAGADVTAGGVLADVRTVLASARAKTPADLARAA